LDIKPQNFFVGEKGILKLGDFNLSRKKSKFDDDCFEGDSTYMAPEILEVTRIKNLDERCDIFSLGLSLIEILFRIELPQNGPLWRQIRSESFKIPNEFYEHSNITNIPEDFYKLIYGMINFDPKTRYGISYIFENFPALKVRLEALNKNQYETSYDKSLANWDSAMQTPKKLRSKQKSDLN
jgi:serine/threonine protein kinase